MSEEVISKEHFMRLGAWGKGYAVYMHGHREEQPNIPRTYTEGNRSRWWHDSYKRGQSTAERRYKAGQRPPGGAIDR